jgi:hypothetical protein
MDPDPNPAEKSDPNPAPKSDPNPECITVPVRQKVAFPAFPL